MRVNAIKNLAFALAIACSVYAPVYSQAQPQNASQAVPALPFFVGLHTLRSGYEVFFPATVGEAGVDKWQLTAGFNPSVRLAVQAGICWEQKSTNQDPVYQGTSLSGQYLDGSRYNERRTYSVPVLVRYAVVRSPRPRLQMDAVLGLTLLGSKYRLAEVRRIDHQVVSSFEDYGQATQLYATAGIGLRYSFGQHFEGVLDWTYSKNFRSAPDYVHLNVTGNKYGLTRAVSLGLRYRFAIKKKAAVDSGP